MSKNKFLPVLIVFCSIKLILSLIADYHSGFQGDELLHIETGNHPAIGYMEFPPVIGWLAFLQNQFGSSSVFVHHLFSHLASILIMVLLALTTVELGGRTKAVMLVLLAVLVSAGFGRSQQLFQPVVFSQLCWVFSFYQLVRFVKTPSSRYLLYLTLSLILGMMTKYDTVFFIAGLVGLLFFRQSRVFILQASTLKYIGLFLLLLAPNIWWQYQHDFPVLQMFDRLYEKQLNQLSAGEVVLDLLIAMNPLTALIWIGGLVYMFRSKNKQVFQPLAVTVVLSILFLAISRSKFYYFFPVVLVLLVFGGIWMEQWLVNRRKWALYVYTGLLILSGLVMIPFGLAVLPLNSFIKFAKIEKEDERYPVEHSEYYAPVQWSQTMEALQQVYDSLPEEERRDCRIWGKHYRQAGAVNLYRHQYKLPEAFSYHGSFYIWAPAGQMPATVIAYTNGEASIRFFQNYFNEVIAVKRVHNLYADDDKNEWQTIYVCKSPKQSFDDMKELFRKRIFE